MSADNMPRNNSYYKIIGDVANAVNVAIALAFAGCVLFLREQLFDADWARDGFCVAKDIQLPFSLFSHEHQHWNSHDLCLFVDVPLALLLATLYLVFRNTSGMKEANSYALPFVLGQLAHGMGHGLVGAQMRGINPDDTVDEGGIVETVSLIPLGERFRQESITRILVTEAASTLFWFGLTVATTQNSAPVATVALISVSSQVGQSYMPVQLQFMYVQTVLAVVHSWTQLRLPKSAKNNAAYALFAVVVSVPTVFVGWMESTQCSSFVRDFMYGHVVYDSYIASSLIVWYLLCYLNKSETWKQKEA